MEDDRIEEILNFLFKHRGLYQKGQFNLWERVFTEAHIDEKEEDEYDQIYCFFINDYERGFYESDCP